MKSEAKFENKCMFGFNHRHHESMLKMKEIIDSRKLGKILWMRGRYGKEVDKNSLKVGGQILKSLARGILLDQGIHMLDLFIYLAGSFDIFHSLISTYTGKFHS